MIIPEFNMGCEKDKKIRVLPVLFALAFGASVCIPFVLKNELPPKP